MDIYMDPWAGTATPPGEAPEGIDYALIKKKIKFSSYVRKFRIEQSQNHI